jgi:phage head maturation protease
MGMVENSPSDVRDTERLHQYWVHGEGAAKIRWGEPGDFDRCVLHLGKFIRDPQGYCNLAHHAALGIYPATHAAMIKHATGRANVADTKAPYGDVPYGDPGYLDADGNQASKSGKPGVKRYPLTADKVMAAWSYINQDKNASQYTPDQLKAIKGRIQAAMGKHGHDVAEPASSGRTESLASYVRAFPLEDISVRTTRDGRIVDAYLAVFNTPAPIHDQDGDYSEELDPVVFNRAISDARPQGSRTSWRVGVFYNHGLTIMGTPSDRHSMPVAVPLDIKTDGHGVRATDKYHRSQFCDEIVEGLESGAIPGYSFSGRFLRSNPLIPRGGFRKGRDGSLPTVRRMESTLREYGPTPFPAYADAAVLGIRSDSLMAAMMNDPELAMRMISAFRGGAPDGDSLPLPGAPPDGDSPAEDSHLLVRSGRSVKEQIQANRAALLQRQYRS